MRSSSFGLWHKGYADPLSHKSYGKRRGFRLYTAQGMIGYGNTYGEHSFNGAPVISYGYGKFGSPLGTGFDMDVAVSFTGGIPGGIGPIERDDFGIFD